MTSREPLTGGRITHQGVAQVLLEQEERRIRQGMRVNQGSWRKDHGLRKTVWPRNGAIILAGGILLGWAGSRFWDR